jgi:hypothetical protein
MPTKKMGTLPRQDTPQTLGKSGKAICKNCTSAKVVLLLSIVFPAKSFMLLNSFFGQVVEYYLLL